jgi:hypothetical protein
MRTIRRPASVRWTAGFPHTPRNQAIWRVFSGGAVRKAESRERHAVHGAAWWRQRCNGCDAGVNKLDTGAAAADKMERHKSFHEVRWVRQALGGGSFGAAGPVSRAGWRSVPG